MSKSANAIETLSATLTGMFTPDAEPVRDNNALDRAAVRAKRYPSQEAHAARRTASIKDSAGGKVVEKVKEASKRTSKGKSANKPGNPVPLAGRAAEQNGIKAPQREGAIATCWALFDEHPETTSLDLLNYCEALDMNLGNMKIEFYRWRRFNGLVTPRK